MSPVLRAVAGCGVCATTVPAGASLGTSTATGAAPMARNTSSATERCTPTKLGVSPLLDPGEASALLAEPDTALVVATRGRVIRRDVVVLAPAYDGAPPGSPRKASGEVLDLDPILTDLGPS